MSHDNTWPIATKALNLGLTKLHNNKQVVIGTVFPNYPISPQFQELMRTALDHDVSNKSESNMRKYALIEEFARKHKTWWYPAGFGIGHQTMLDQGE
jgi:homoaconitate hydratase